MSEDRKHITAGDIRASLRRHYAAPEAAICFEVAQGTGTHARRHLDAVAMELWPSRGLALIGIEIKVDYYDWRREKADPSKAEEIARFLDYFYIAAPPGVVPTEELPSAWGLMEIGNDGAMAIKREAAKTEAQPVTRLFLAAVMRAATRPLDQETIAGSLAAERKRLEQEFKERVRYEVEQITGRHADYKSHWERLIEALGHDPERSYDDPEIITAVKAVMTAGVAKTWSGLATLRDSLGEAYRNVQAVAGDLGLAQERKTKRRKVS